jgi:hypothetical protein
MPLENVTNIFLTTSDLYEVRIVKSYLKNKENRKMIGLIEFTYLLFLKALHLDSTKYKPAPFFTITKVTEHAILSKCLKIGN